MQHSTSIDFQIARGSDAEKLQLSIEKLRNMGYETYGEETYFPPHLTGKKEGEYVQIMVKSSNENRS